MKKTMVMCFLLSGLVFQSFQAFGLELATSVIAGNIQDRTPQLVADSFPNSVEKLYCFSHIIGADKETSVTHVWLWEGHEMARVKLQVRSSSWRTWSSKTLSPEWTGSWEVKILDEQDLPLGTVLFKVRPKE
ncbi:MAG: DUF2914 domain-containing protein [Deltaproteobacteria bacterium]|nr:DUF2914 domain-containing protein [Deltaproteobacteria bacterium]